MRQDKETGSHRRKKSCREPNKHYVFTPELWDKWRRARKPDADTERLRQGIRIMQALLERPHDRWPLTDEID